MRAATNLLGRAVGLYPTDDRRRLSLLPVLGAALHEAGEWDRAEAFLTEAMELGRAADDRRTVAHASVALTNLRLYRGSFDSHDSIRAALADAVVVFEELGDRGGLGRALGIAGQLKFWAGRSADALGDLELAAEHARSAGDRLQEVSSLAYGLLATTIGPMPAPAALELIEQIRGRADGHPRLEIAILRCQAFLRAIQGGFEPARALIADALALSDAMGLKVAAAGVRLEAGRVELLDGQADAAVRVIRPGLEALEAMGDRGHFVTVAPILADALVAKGDDEEAERLLELTAAWALDDDIDPQISRRRVQAKLHARHGELDEAERLAREAVELAGRTDYTIDHARALEDLAEVLRFAGRPAEGATELRRALGLYEAKGDLVSAANVRALLERPRPAPADSDEIRAESPA
jgi:tetratricopeptide (TPR) repeat protein